MKRILVATDLSTRSDRALLRSVLLARETGAVLTLAHVVDEDQPAYLREPHRSNALKLLNRTAATVAEADGIAVDVAVVIGTGFGAIISAAEKAYRRTLVAMDFDDASCAAIRDAARLDMIGRTEVIALHVFEAVAIRLMRRAGDSADAIDHYVRGEKARVATDMDQFLVGTGLPAARRLLKRDEGSPVGVIVERAQEEAVELIVLVTHQRKGLERFLIGSVAQGVLVNADCDVPVSPDPSNSAAGLNPGSVVVTGRQRQHSQSVPTALPAEREPWTPGSSSSRSH